MLVYLMKFNVMKSNITYKVAKALYEGKSYNAISTAYNVDFDFIRVVSKMNLDIGITKPVPKEPKKESFKSVKAKVRISSYYYGTNQMLSDNEMDYGLQIPVYKHNDLLEKERFNK